MKHKYGIPDTDENKYRIISKLDEYLQGRLKDAKLVDYIIYMEYNNELASKGYFITDSNREEMYLKILETGDDTLIDILEQYLIMKDKLSFITFARKTFTDIFEKLFETDESDTEALNKLESLIPN